jgi:hypothetical protein
MFAADTCWPGRLFVTAVPQAPSALKWHYSKLHGLRKQGSWWCECIARISTYIAYFYAVCHAQAPLILQIPSQSSQPAATVTSAPPAAVTATVSQVSFPIRILLISQLHLYMWCSRSLLQQWQGLLLCLAGCLPILAQTPSVQIRIMNLILNHNNQRLLMVHYYVISMLWQHCVPCLQLRKLLRPVRQRTHSTQLTHRVN